MCSTSIPVVLQIVTGFEQPLGRDQCKTQSSGGAIVQELHYISSKSCSPDKGSSCLGIEKAWYFRSIESL